MTDIMIVPDEPVPSMVFMRRHQAADMIISLAFNECRLQQMPEMKGFLVDALHELHPESFMADDWSDILIQVTQALLSEQPTLNALLMPAALKAAIFQLNTRLSMTCSAH